MSRINDSELQTLKQNVSLLRLAEAQGYELKEVQIN